jgi:hypothetical protein
MYRLNYGIKEQWARLHQVCEQSIPRLTFQKINEKGLHCSSIDSFLSPDTRGKENDRLYRLQTRGSRLC